MYVYVYDGFVTDKKHEKLLSRVETRLTDLGISGRIERLTMFKDIGEIVADAVEQGCETIVAVGNDETVGRLIDVIGMRDMAFGVIPIGDGPHSIAGLMGIEDGVEACNILSRRVLHTVDLGRINDHYFLSSVMIPRTRAAMSCNGQYSVIPTEDNEVRICNLAPMTVTAGGEASISSPHDGFLQTVFQPSPSRGFFSRLFRAAEPLPSPTVVPVRTLTIRHKQPVTVMRDGQRLSSSILNIEVLPNRLKIITGKSRKFE
jgi:diacylglycerol kinase family enzyme